MLFDLVVSENKFSLICLTFTGTLNQLHFTLLFMFTSFRTISYFSFFISLFLWSMHACLRGFGLAGTRKSYVSIVVRVSISFAFNILSVEIAEGLFGLNLKYVLTVLNEYDRVASNTNADR